MTFKNREDAGRQLAKQLGVYANREDVMVLGIPRGGIAVAFEVAHALNVPLDIFLSRKLGVPGHEEYAFGAIAAGDGRYLDAQIIKTAGISEDQIERVTQEAKQTLQRAAAVTNKTYLVQAAPNTPDGSFTNAFTNLGTVTVPATPAITTTTKTPRAHLATSPN